MSGTPKPEAPKPEILDDGGRQWIGVILILFAVMVCIILFSITR